MVVKQILLDIVIISLLAANLYFTFSLNSKLNQALINGENHTVKFQNNFNSLNLSFKSDCGKEVKGYDGIFIYSPACPFSRRMIPIIEKSKLKWYWANVLDSKCREMNLTEFNYKGFVPHFYCFKTNVSHTGAMSEGRFSNWTASFC